MPKPKILFVCSSCGGEHLRWQGKCQFCGEWNTLKEIQNLNFKFQNGEARKPKKLSEITLTHDSRLSTGIEEFDRVLGGGVARGSAVLLSGSPGVGKSTLLLQLSEKIGKKSPVVYVSGEESEEQIARRAQRLGTVADNLYFLNQTDLGLMLAELEEMSSSGGLGLVIVDSLQTTATENATGSAGSPSQLKFIAASLTSFAKEKGIPLIMTGHVTKNFAIGGPKFLEHIVDVVLTFEGEKFSSFRILRASKNRFGAISEVGIFEMKKEGLVEVKDPSEAFLKNQSKAPGGALMVAMEGTRPLLLEIQALTSAMVYRYPKRTTQGLSSKRALLILAVLEKFGNLNLSRSDIFVKSSFGMRVFEPAADLAIAAAVASSRLKKPISPKLCFFGEVGLNGEVRAVSGDDDRRRHAKKLGLTPIGAQELPTVKELFTRILS